MSFGYVESRTCNNELGFPSKELRACPGYFCYYWKKCERKKINFKGVLLNRKKQDLIGEFSAYFTGKRCLN